MSGAKHLDEGKAPLALVPRALVVEVAKVLDYGAKKYEKHNWRKGSQAIRFANSALRHLFAWLDGESSDPESGLSHLSHAACNLGFLLQWQADGILEDDRYRRPGLPKSDETVPPGSCSGAVRQDPAVEVVLERAWKESAL